MRLSRLLILGGLFVVSLFIVPSLTARSVCDALVDPYDALADAIARQDHAAISQLSACALEAEGVHIPAMTTVGLAAQTACDPSRDNAAIGAHAYAVRYYGAATLAYQCALQANPMDSDLYFRLGDAELLQGRYSHALSNYGMGMYFDPSLEQVNRETQARIDAVNAQPTDINTHILRAAWYWAMGLDSRAFPDYEAILARDNDHLLARVLRGSSFYFIGDRQRGEHDFNLVRTEAPDNAELLSLIALTYSYVGELEQARETATRAIEIDSTLPYAYRARSVANAGLQNIEAALADIEQRIALFPEGYGGVWVEWASLLYSVGRDIEGEAVLQQAYQLAADDPQLNFMVGEMFLDTDPPRAGQAFLDWFDDIGMSAAAAPNTITIGEPLDVHVTYQTCYDLAFEATEGQVLTLSASASSGIDPLIVLLDPQGTPLIAHDDMNGFQNLTARISEFTIPEDGIYTLVVAHAGAGNDGITRVRISETD